MGWGSRILDAALLSVPVTIGLMLVWFYMGWAPTLADVASMYVKAVIGATVLFWLLKK